MSIQKVTSEKNIRLYGWISFLSGVTFLTPVITALYQHSGLSIGEIVVISNVATLAIWVFELPTSVIADIFGRKKSLIASVLCNLLSAIFILFFPSYLGFVIASFFSGLYFSFWSGAGQAFLEENLRTVGKEQDFGKVLGKLMSYEKVGTLLIPLIATLLLKYFGAQGYFFLAFLDVISAGVLVFLTIRLREFFSRKNFSCLREIFTEHVVVAKSAFVRIFSEKNLWTLVLYRSFANHVAFFPLILFPIVIGKGMPEYLSGVIVSVATVGAIIGSWFVYKVGEKHSYNSVWIISTVLQAILLVIAGIFFQYSWWVFVIVYVIFEVFESLWQPAWNHVLVEQSKGISVATTRSIIFSIFALYTTVGKQILSFFSPEVALILVGIIMIIANIILGREIQRMKYPS